MGFVPVDGTHRSAEIRIAFSNIANLLTSHSNISGLLNDQLYYSILSIAPAVHSLHLRKQINTMQRIYLSLLFLMLFSLFAASQSPRGFYAGVQVGYSIGKINMNGFTQYFNQVTNVNPPGPQPLTVVPGTSRQVAAYISNENSIAAGIQLGYQKQKNKWLYGGELNFTYSKMQATQTNKDSIPPTALTGVSPYSIEHTAALNFSITLAPKLGYAFGQGFIYVMPGLFMPNVEVKANDSYTAKCCGAYNPPPQFAMPPSYTNTNSDQKFAIGPSFGIGFDWAISEQLSTGVSFHYNTASQDFTIEPNTSHPEGFDPSTGQYMDPAASGSALVNSLTATTQKVKFSQNLVMVKLNWVLNATARTKK